MNQLKISIVSALKSKSDRGLRLSALKKQCLNDNTTNQISSGDFDKALHALMSKKKIVMKDGIYFFQSKDAKNESDEKIVKNKRKRDSVEEVEENGSDEKNAHVTKKGISKSSVSKESESESLPYEKPKDLWKTGEQAWRDGTIAPQYLLDNPDGITRLFVGNLNKNITEEQLKSCIEGITFIKWITDKSTGQFYGSTFVEMKDKKSAIEAVMKDRQKFMGRPLKIYYCPPKPGDIWPPKPSTLSHDNVKKPPSGREKTPKPNNCKKLYIGNLSYTIDDDTIVEFFKDCGQLIGLRWLTHKDSGEFRGCGFIEFSSTEEADKAIKLDGQELLGR